MKRALIRKDNWFEKTGLYIFFLFLAIHPFHNVISVKFVFYREVFSLFFFSLWFLKITLKNNLNIIAEHKVANQVMLMTAFFPFLLLLFSLFDSGKNLYQSTYTDASTMLSSISPSLYVLRNAILYIPMIFYFSLRGLKEKEIQKISFIIVLFGGISIPSFLVTTKVLALEALSINSISDLSGIGTSYNSFVPYLTILITSSLYLLSSSNIKMINKLLILVIFIFTLLYIFLSTSRQAFLFSVISIIYFFLMNKEIKKIQNKYLFLMIVSICLFLFSGLQISERIESKYSSLSGIFLSDSRTSASIDGLKLLDFDEYFFGAGLSSVIVSGPHNDYIRWWQRVGFFVMIIGFLPFFMAFYNSYIQTRSSLHNTLDIHITLFIGFTLYHSLFGYPREDAYQSPYCFIGLSLWIGLLKERLSNYQLKSL